ncbi:6375_t:CDS:2, partial [Ambispora leptoticha]
LIDEDFQPLDPVTCQPLIWDMEREEAQQMQNDIHTQVNYQRPLQGANVVLTGGSDISIGPSGTACVWIETKKTKEDFKEDSVQCIAKSKIGDRGTALAIIKQFVLEEGINLSAWTGKEVIYSVDKLALLQKKTKFLERIPEDDETRMADMVDDMSEQELFNMTARKRLRMLRNWCRLDEQPQVDQLIRQFSDDYEKLSPMMFT